MTNEERNLLEQTVEAVQSLARHLCGAPVTREQMGGKLKALQDAWLLTEKPEPRVEMQALQDFLRANSSMESARVRLASGVEIEAVRPRGEKGGKPHVTSFR